MAIETPYLDRLARMTDRDLARLSWAQREKLARNVRREAVTVRHRLEDLDRRLTDYAARNRIGHNSLSNIRRELGLARKLNLGDRIA